MAYKLKTEIGKAIYGQHQGVFLATKSTSRSRQDIEGHLNLSLERLSVKSIDLYQFHGINDFKALETVLIDPEADAAEVMQQAAQEAQAVLDEKLSE